MTQGKLIVISGPSGAGKDSILKPVLAGRTDFSESVIATTRAPRAGEVDGVDYFFMSATAFQEALDQGQFLEYAPYSGHLYGTPKSAIMAHLLAGRNVAMIVEVQGGGTDQKGPS